MRSRLLLLGKPNNKLTPSDQYPGGARAIKSGCTRKEYEELTESLIRANPNSTGVFESPGETNAHDLIRIKIHPAHLCTVKRQIQLLHIVLIRMHS